MRVYHFLSAANALNDLIFRRVRASRYADLNDPFELLAFNVGDPVMREAMKGYREEFNKKFGLLCFCKGVENPLLWSHYADKHRGICLGFDISDAHAMTVEYSKDRIKVEFENNDPSTGRISERSMHSLLHTKFAGWSYEEEVRVQVALENQEAGSYYVPFDGEQVALREVILGAMCELPLPSLYEFLGKYYGKEVELFKAGLTYKWYAVKKQKVIP